jgi:hypothetical protein
MIDSLSTKSKNDLSACSNIPRLKARPTAPLSEVPLLAKFLEVQIVGYKEDMSIVKYFKSIIVYNTKWANLKYLSNQRLCHTWQIHPKECTYLGKIYESMAVRKIHTVNRICLTSLDSIYLYFGFNSIRNDSAESSIISNPASFSPLQWET